jgi:hypothetical protein
MTKTCLVDVAVLCQQFSDIEISCDNSNITILDEIEISKENFLNIFYPHGENFGINKTIADDTKNNHFISFEHRTVKGKHFFLLEQILSNIESDLNTPRHCFTTSSLVEITTEFSNLKSLCDLNCCSVVASLPWSNIELILKNYKIHNNSNIIPIFVITIGFKTPTPNVKDTVIKIHYKIITE